MVMLVGNKRDLESLRTVPSEEAQAFAGQISPITMSSLRINVKTLDLKTNILFSPVQCPLNIYHLFSHIRLLKSVLLAFHFQAAKSGHTIVKFVFRAVRSVPL